MPSSRHREFTTTRTHFFIPKIENSKMRKGANVIFRLRNTPIRLPIKSFYTKISTTPLHSILSVCVGVCSSGLENSQDPSPYWVNWSIYYMQ